MTPIVEMVAGLALGFGCWQAPPRRCLLCSKLAWRLCLRFVSSVPVVAPRWWGRTRRISGDLPFVRVAGEISHPMLCSAGPKAGSGCRHLVIGCGSGEDNDELVNGCEGKAGYTRGPDGPSAATRRSGINVRTRGRETSYILLHLVVGGAERTGRRSTSQARFAWFHGFGRPLRCQCKQLSRALRAGVAHSEGTQMGCT